MLKNMNLLVAMVSPWRISSGVGIVFKLITEIKTRPNIKFNTEMAIVN